MSEYDAAPQQPGTPTPPPPPTGAPVYYAAQYDAPQPERKSHKGLIVGIIVGVVVVGIVIVGILAAVAIPIFLEQRGKANDSAAKADASTLGLLIATYYVDNDGPVPDIDLVDGYYVLGEEKSAYPASPEVQFGGTEGTGFTDWCVWVSAPEGTEKDFNYSAARGLSAGTC